MGLFGHGLTHFGLREVGHGGFACGGVCQRGQMGAQGNGLFFQGDFFGQNTCFGHDAKAYGDTCADEGIAGVIWQRFAFTGKAGQLALRGHGRWPVQRVC